MPIVEISRIQVRRGLENQTGVPVLDSGEFGWASDTENLYIGLRRVDGGNRDANVRILTENDLPNFFANDPAPVLNTLYTFRKDSDLTKYQWTGSPPDSEVVRLLQEKLDDFVSVKDFGAVGDGSDSTAAILQAIQKLASSTSTVAAAEFSTSTRKTIYFPAGEYRITGALPLPSYARILGEGMQNTIISSFDTGYHFFETKDNANQSFDNNPGTMDTVQYVSVENLSLIRKNTSLAGKAFISLDNARHALVSNVRFYTSATTSTLNLTSSSYVGINIRNTGTNYDRAQRIKIENCSFELMNAGVSSDHAVSDIEINQCSFEYLYQGVAFNRNNTSTNLGPRSVTISNNDFNRIYAHGIFADKIVGNDDLYYGHIISQNNRFYNVANFSQGDDDTPSLTGFPPFTISNSTGTSIIFFGSKGNLSQNDFFNRERQKITDTNNTTTMYPLIDGHGTLEYTIPIVQLSQAATTSSLRSSNAFFVPFTNSAQKVSVEYFICDQASPPAIDRRGVLDISVGPGYDPEVYLTDNYGYIYDGDFIGSAEEWRYEKRALENCIKFYFYNPELAGSGAQFNVTNSPYPAFTGLETTGTYSNIVIPPSSSSGTNYQVNDLIRISAADYDSPPGSPSSLSSTATTATSAQDIFITVTGIGPGGSVASFTWTGTGVTTVTTQTATNVVGTVVARAGDPGFGIANVYLSIKPKVTLTKF